MPDLVIRKSLGDLLLLRYRVEQFAMKSTFLLNRVLQEPVDCADIDGVFNFATIVISRWGIGCHYFSGAFFQGKSALTSIVLKLKAAC